MLVEITSTEVEGFHQEVIGVLVEEVLVQETEDQVNQEIIEVLGEEVIVPGITEDLVMEEVATEISIEEELIILGITEDQAEEEIIKDEIILGDINFLGLFNAPTGQVIKVLQLGVILTYYLQLMVKLA